MLARVVGGTHADPPRYGAVRRLGEALPLGLRRGVTQRIPARLRDRIMTSWATGGTSWSETQAFSLRADLQGYVRINLSGRELEGIVPPSEYDALCERLVAGLMSFRDAETGDPVVAEVRRPVEVFGPGEREQGNSHGRSCKKQNPLDGGVRQRRQQHGRSRSRPKRVNNRSHG